MQRRDFLKATATSAACFSFSGLTLSLPGTAQAIEAVSITLVAESIEKTLVDGTKVRLWQFRDTDDPGPGLLASGLHARVGDFITVTLTNLLDWPISFVVPGMLDVSTAVAPGATGSYVFRPTKAGSYFYTDGENGLIGRAMGLSGPLIVLPRGTANALTANWTRFVKQYTLLLTEIDSRLNEAISSGLTFDMATYKPNYFFINGLSYPDTKTNPSTFLDMALGDTVAIRFLNAGLIFYPMHFHGYHVNVTLRDRHLETRVVAKDSVLVKVGECVDMMLYVNQTGDYPIHSHYLPAVTANGVYPKGNMLLMRAV